ncbi:MAG: hypothetical protein LLG20_07060 [Acidobacteriales bacterium]|nr:hypothetical protein [Terriglobales bacterium]
MTTMDVCMTRRSFGMASLANMFALTHLASASSDDGPWSGPALVRTVFLISQKPSWPRPDVDANQEMSDIRAQLEELSRRHPGKLRYTGGDLLREGTDISAWIGGAKDADVVLAFNLSSGLGAILQKVVSTGRPTLLFSRPYAGHSWTTFSDFAKQGVKADVIASSDFGELDAYVPLFRTIHYMRNSKVMLVSPPTRARRGEDYTTQFGTSFAYPSYADLKAAFDGVDVAKARKEAAAFTKAALRVVEPSENEIIDSMRLYHGMSEFMRKEKANAIAIDCLGGFARGELPAYPCVSFSKLNDAGLYGVCECDLASTMTQLLVTSFSNMPGFVTDPVFDTSHNEVIHAHCVAATKMAGIEGPASPYVVRSHLEDNKGVSMQVLAPESGTVTVARFAKADKFLISTAEVIGNADGPRGCRTKVRTRVSDARKFLRAYSAGLHRVLFYGDHTENVDRLSRLTGFQMVREI